MKHYILIVTLIMLSLSLASCAGVSPVIAPSVSEKNEITFLFTGNTGGSLEPRGCGCRRMGGLARRAHLIDEKLRRNPNIIVMDTGNLLQSPREAAPAAHTKADYMLAALGQMQTEFLNAGLSDCAAGLRTNQRQTFSILSANLVSAETAELLFTPYSIRKTNRIKIGIFGLSGCTSTSRPVAQRTGIRCEAPVPAAQATVNKLQQKSCDMIIMLSQLSLKDNKALAAQVPGIDFILGSASGETLKAPYQVGGTAIMASGTNGTHMAQLTLTLEHEQTSFYNERTRDLLAKKIEELRRREENPDDGTRLEDVVVKRMLLEKKIAGFTGKNLFRYDLIPLDATIADDPDIELLVEKHKEELVRLKLPAFKQTVPTVDLSALSVSDKIKALRLMNELTCNEAASIAAAAPADTFCRGLAQHIITGISQGLSEGKIRYQILYRKAQPRSAQAEFSLDMQQKLQ
ncbi:MAG: bifunctional metallophosphatase/5'-nucleotidase [Deltaproteobacteria bacterium]|nr:bifunctional metallophosphatase/5'-nucleotidase [Deltaproteobacteria bacterium]